MMRLVRACLIACSLLAVFLSQPLPALGQAWDSQAVQALVSEGVRVRDLPAQEGAAVEAWTFVAAPRVRVLAVLWDHERFPEFMPQARSVRVLRRTGATHVVEQLGGHGPLSLKLLTERVLERDRVVWRAVGGDLKRNDGAWQVYDAPGGTVLHYRVHVVPWQPVPSGVTRFLQRQALPGMLEAVRRRVEREGMPASTSPLPG